MLKFATRLDFVFPTAHKNIAVDSNPTIGGVVSAKPQGRDHSPIHDDLPILWSCLTNLSSGRSVESCSSKTDRIHLRDYGLRTQSCLDQIKLRSAVILKPTEDWKPKNCRDPNNRQNNSKRDKTHWPMCREFPTKNFTIWRHRSGTSSDQQPKYVSIGKRSKQAAINH
jgi:hypothetical protein